MYELLTEGFKESIQEISRNSGVSEKVAARAVDIFKRFTVAAKNNRELQLAFINAPIDISKDLNTRINIESYKDLATLNKLINHLESWSEIPTVQELRSGDIGAAVSEWLAAPGPAMLVLEVEAHDPDSVRHVDIAQCEFLQSAERHCITGKEQAVERGTALMSEMVAAPLFSAIFLLLSLVFAPDVLWLAYIFNLIWLASPYVAYRISRATSFDTPALSPEEQQHLNRAFRPQPNLGQTAS